MIDLNSLSYTNLSTDLILSKVSDYQIFAYYIPNLELNKSFNSPLRKDEIPSFGVFYANSLGKLIFNDFCTKEKGDCFVFVSKLFGINYYQALQKIAYDFGLIEHNPNINLTTIQREIPKNYDYKKNVKEVHIGIKKQPFTSKDLKFWNQYGISKDTLSKYNVFSCTHIFLNDYIIVVDNFKNPAYAYLECKDDKYTYKIYQPYNKEQRFISNVDKSVWQGWTQLPAEGEKLIITKSLKDVMSITEITNIPAVSLQAESTYPKVHIIDILKNRFKNIYVLYDNDFDKETNWGRLYSSQVSSEFNLNQLELEDKYKSKDFSDLVKNHGINFSKNYLINLIQHYEKH